MRKLSKRDRRALVAGLITTVFILVVIYVLFPFLDARESVSRKLSERGEYLQRSVNAIRYREYYEQQLAAVEEVLGQYERQLLEAQEPNAASSTLSTLVRELAQLTGVDVQRTNPLPPQNVKEKYVKISVQVTLQGGMPELTNFLSALAAHDKFLQVEEFSINAFRARNNIRLQPRMNISGYIRLST